MGEPKVVIVDFIQDADSFGWSIAALFHARYTPDRRRWGILDALVSTSEGHGPAVKNERTGLTKEEVIASQWNLIDWYDIEEEAREAFAHMRSRRW